MSQDPSILSYQHVTEPEVRLPRAAFGAAILALGPTLLLAFYFLSGIFFSLLWSKGILQGLASAATSIAVFSLLSICVPLGTHLLATAKLPRIHAGHIVGTSGRRAACAAAILYATLRISAGIFRICFYTFAPAADSRDLRLQLAWASEAASPFALAFLLIAAWLYMTDLSLRLRRGIYLTLATLALGLSLLIVLAMALSRMEMYTGPLYAPAARSLVGTLGSDVFLCLVQALYWTLTATMLRSHRTA